MSDKPSYLGLLKPIALAESEAHEYLTAWAAVTPHDGVRATLSCVAAREGEHGMSFARRVNELGYSLKPRPDDGKRAERMAIACSTEMGDFEKMHALGVAAIAKATDADGPDPFDGFFADHSIDIQTGALLGRYIAEERDSGRLLRDCYRAVEAEHEVASSTRTGNDSAVKRLERKVDALTEAVDELRRSVAPTEARTNGRSKARASAK